MLYSVLTLVLYRLMGAMFRKTISRAKKMFAPGPPPEVPSLAAKLVGSRAKREFSGQPFYFRKNTHQTTSSIGSMKGSAYWKT